MIATPSLPVVACGAPIEAFATWLDAASMTTRTASATNECDAASKPTLAADRRLAGNGIISENGYRSAGQG